MKNSNIIIRENGLYINTLNICKYTNKIYLDVNGIIEM